MSNNLETHWRLMLPSQYLCAADLRGKDARVKIKSVSKAELNLEGRSEKKLSVLVYFEGKQKALVANKTNLKAIAKQHGNLTAAWAGKEVVLFPTTCKLGREMVDCIRVRPGGDAPIQEDEQ